MRINSTGYSQSQATTTTTTISSNYQHQWLTEKSATWPPDDHCQPGERVDLRQSLTRSNAHEASLQCSNNLAKLSTASQPPPSLPTCPAPTLPTKPTPSNETVPSVNSRASPPTTITMEITRHSSKAAKKEPPGNKEQEALDREKEQQDKLRAEEIYTRMRAERILHQTKMQAIMEDLRTELRRIWEEVILRRNKVQAEMLKNWHKAFVG